MPNQTSPKASEDAVSEMTTVEFLTMLKERHIRIQARDGQLQINAPAGAIDAVLRTELKYRKLALLDAVCDPRPAMEATELRSLTAAELCGRIPLTPAQEGIWLIDHFDPGNAAYNIPEAFRIEERIDPEELQFAIDRLIERHSILRTSFHQEDGELFQTIAPSLEATIGFTDLALIHDDACERSCRELIRSEGRRAFDLTQAPLMRLHLFRLAERRHVIFLNVHHIISDRRSMYVLRDELLALSRSSQGRSDAALPAMHLQFADFAVWMAQRLKGEAVERQVGYWKKKLGGLPAYLELPHSRPWPKQRTSIGATKPVFVSAKTRRFFNVMGAQEGASPFITFLAIFALTVARWSRGGAPAGPVDFCIGSPITHRKHAATERMIGLFVNMLAFRCRIEPGMSFRDVLRHVRSTALEAYENSDVPFRRLVCEINPDRRSQRSPIFQVMFGYETYLPPTANEFQMDAEPGRARYDLSLHLSETADNCLTGVVEYCADLFEDADIDRFLTGSGDVVAAIVRNPEQDVFSIQAFVEGRSGSGHSGYTNATDAPGAISGSKPSSGGGVFRKFARLFSSL